MMAIGGRVIGGHILEKKAGAVVTQKQQRVASASLLAPKPGRETNNRGGEGEGENSQVRQ
jgi:hypothetical protein